MNADKLRLRRCRIKQVCDSSAPSGSAQNLVKGANNAVDNKRVSGQSQTSKNKQTGQTPFQLLLSPCLSAFIRVHPWPFLLLLFSSPPDPWQTSKNSRG